MNQDEMIHFFHLKELCDIFHVIGFEKGNGNYHFHNIPYNEKRYDIVKDKDSIVIQCSDGRKLECSLDFYLWDETVEGRPEILNSVNLRIHYFLPNNDILTLVNERRNKGYSHFEKLKLEDLMNGLRLEYSSATPNFCIDINSCDDYKLHRPYENKITFKSDAIEFGTRKFTVDGESLITNDYFKEVSMKDIKDYNLKGEKKKVMHFIEENSSFNKLTANFIASSLEHMDLSSYSRIYSNYYPICKKIIAIRNNLVCDHFNQYTFSSEELQFLIHTLYSQLNQKKREITKETAIKKYERLLKELQDVKGVIDSFEPTGEDYSKTY